MWWGTEAGSYLRLIDSCITQHKAQGPSRICNESKEEERTSFEGGPGASASAVRSISLCLGSTAICSST